MNTETNQRSIASFFQSIALVFVLFVLIVNVVFLYATISIWSSSQSVQQEALPLLESSTNLAEIIPRIQGLAIQIINAKVQTEVKAEFEEIKKLIASSSQVPVGDQAYIDRRKLQELELMAASLYKLKLDYLLLQTSFEQKWLVYSNKSGHSYQAIMGMVADLSLSHWEYLMNMANKDKPDNFLQNNIEAFEQIYLQKEEVSDLIAAMGRLDVLVQRLKLIQQSEVFAVMSHEFEIAHRDAVRTVASLPEEKRLTIAAYLDDLYKAFYSENSLFKEKRRLLGLQEEILAVGERIQSVNLSLNMDLQLVVEKYYERATEIALEVEQNAKYILYLSLSLVILFPFVLWYVFRFQLYENLVLNIMGLTDDIKAIASGHLDKPVQHYGLIELNESANALETFQDNAVQLHATSKTLADKVEQLKNTNQDLERINHIASHDLKSPIHAAQNLVNWIKEDAENQLSEESTQFFSLLNDRLKRMSVLLKDLYNYTRISRIDDSYSMVNLEVVARSILREKFPDQRVLLHAHDIDVYLPRLAFETVLGNLISNAVMHADSESIVIHVRYVCAEVGHQIIVEDNGPGIPPNLQDKAREMFQTLKPRDKLEASGLGLAIVDKLMQKHGGSMEIDSDGESGTAIITSWPIHLDQGAPE